MVSVRSFSSCTRGNVALMFALCGLVLAAICGFGITAAQMDRTGRHLQDSADGFALNAAVAIKDGASLQQARARAQAQVGPNQKLSLKLSEAGEVTATVTQDVAVVFAALFGPDYINIKRDATAEIIAGDPVCLLVLSPGEPDAFSRRGSSSLEAPACAVQVNSTAAGALDSRGGGSVETLRTLVSGKGAQTTGFSPAPRYGSPPITDPYTRTIVWPSTHGCLPKDLTLRKVVRTIPAGVHCGDVDLGPGADLTLGAGVHVIVGSLSMRAGAKLTTENGATLVFVGPSSTLDVQAGSDLRVSAPSTGPWAGVAIAIKPQSSELSSEIQGGGSVELDGVVYLPSQRVVVTGGGSLAEPTEATRMFVVNRFELRGNGQVFLNARQSRATTDAGPRLIR